MLKHFHPALFLGEPDLIVKTEAAPTVPTPSAPTSKPKIVVHVIGAVKSPGVYYFSTGTRVHEAIEKAGGRTNRAEVGGLNLAAKIRDGQQIYVPEIRQIPNSGQAVPVPGAAPEQTTPAALGPSMPSQPPVRRSVAPDGAYININTATSQELQTLRGIGPVRAQRIVEYRQRFGRFSTVDDLTNVKGIGEKTLEQIRDNIVVY